MIVSVTKAEYIKDYSIMLNFDNGVKGVVDLKSTIFNDHRKIFEPLKNIEFFKKFSLDSWTIVWSNELDLAPEYLYSLIENKGNVQANKDS
ncbi:MAG: DUF2442 domain-containing protein [Bacteroidales bacterium]|nr:DUF2442 domain-containing protein [Bacteroidales bacterium]